MFGLSFFSVWDRVLKVQNNKSTVKKGVLVDGTKKNVSQNKFQNDWDGKPTTIQVKADVALPQCHEN